MDFSTWSPSHLLIAIITLLMIIGQAVALFTYLKTTAKQHSLEIQKIAEQIQTQGERLEDRFDKRISEVNQQICPRFRRPRSASVPPVSPVREFVSPRLPQQSADLM